jgi:hypothetical protein
MGLLTDLNSATISALPSPGGPKGGTPHACHEAKAVQYEKAGNSKMAAKEKQAAKSALDHHHAQGNHKRWALAYPASPSGQGVPEVCKQAAAVQKKNHPGKEGEKRAQQFTGGSTKGSNKSKPH